MIIRSQNKKLIVNFDNVSEVCIRDNSIGMGAIAGGVNFIGTYSTEEKAIKVLDMIQNAYAKMRNCDCIMNGVSVDTAKGSESVIEQFLTANRSLYVFEMPQDSEV